MTTTQIDGGKQIRNLTITNAQIAAGAAIATSKLADGALFIKSDGTVPFGADQSMGSHKLTNVTNPTGAQDAATKFYVDNAISSFLTGANFVVRETPSGAIDGVNTTYTLANTPVAGTENVFLNGLLQEPAAGNDYTISGATITYLTAPLVGDRIRVSYRK